MKRRFIGAIVLFSLLTAAGAHASHDYPRQIHDKYSLGYTPECTMCHATNECGTGTVVTDFGLALIAFGAKGKDAASLDDALDADSIRHWDSDGDGMADIDEVAHGTDPSGPALGRVAGPKHGCALSRGAAPRGAFVAMALVGLISSLLARRRRSAR